MEAARLATDHDIDALGGLFDRAAAEMLPARGGVMFLAREARPNPSAESIALAINAADTSVWVGTIDDFPVGYAIGHTEVVRNGENLGVIEDLFVEDEAREVGVGEALIDALMAWFVERGCAGVDAHALPGDRQTKNFFETSGFSARLLVMHHRLKP